MTDAPGPPAGWYPDTSGSGQLRYWDGTGWTSHYSAQPTAAPAAYGAPMGYGAPPRQGMSGCLKAFLIVLVLLFVGGGLAAVAAVEIGGRVVHHIVATMAGTPGRPASLPSGSAGYTGMRKQDQVANAEGTASLGSLSATAGPWARTTITNLDGSTTRLICGNVDVNRSTVTSSNPIDAAFQLAGNFSWELDTPSGTTVSYDGGNSQATALSNYLTTNQTGAFAGKVCFADPGGHGQFAITWQPRIFRAERMVWITSL